MCIQFLHMGVLMLPSDSTIVSFASWLAEQPLPRSKEDLLLIVKRFKINQLEDVQFIVEQPFSDVFPLLDLV